MKKTDVHIFVWRAMPAIQCARRFFHSYLKKTKKINNQFLIDHNGKHQNERVLLSKMIGYFYKLNIFILKIAWGGVCSNVPWKK